MSNIEQINMFTEVWIPEKSSGKGVIRYRYRGKNTHLLIITNKYRMYHNMYSNFIIIAIYTISAAANSQRTCTCYCSPSEVNLMTAHFQLKDFLKTSYCLLWKYFQVMTCASHCLLFARPCRWTLTYVNMFGSTFIFKFVKVLIK